MPSSDRQANGAAYIVDYCNLEALQGPAMSREGPQSYMDDHNWNGMKGAFSLCRLFADVKSAGSFPSLYSYSIFSGLLRMLREMSDVA